MESFEAKSQRNRRVSARYDELLREGKHGHYETMFRVVREEVELAYRSGLEEAAKVVEDHGHSNGRIRASHKHLAAAIRSLIPSDVSPKE